MLVPASSSLGLDRQCEFSRMKAQYINVIDKVLVDRRAVHWSESELLTSRFETGKLKRAVRRVFALHCPFGPKN